MCMDAQCLGLRRVRRRSRLLAWAAGLLAAGVPGVATAAPSAPPGLNLRVALSAHAATLTPGLRAQTPSAQSEQSQLQQTTGLSLSEVNASNVCGPATPGTAQCLAKVLRLRADDRLVHPRVRAQRAYGTVARPAAPAAVPAQSLPSATTPAWLQQAYDLTYLSQARGAGNTVGIVDAYDDPTAESDLAVYRSRFGLPACTSQNGCFAKVNQSGGTSPMPAHSSGWEQEITLDVDAVSALCPNCKILLVEANTASTTDLNAAFARAVTMGAREVSDSWGMNWSGVLSDAYSVFGVPAIFASGDSGYTGTSADAYPASLPGVIAAGGTSLSAASGGVAGRGFAEGAWALNSSGWGATSGCNLHFAKPTYQADTGCTGRSYADLSADADPSTGLAIYDSGSGGWVQMGGTSLASPLVAAYYAITGTTSATPGWAYTHASLLNDPVGGSVGSCAAVIAYICGAQTGYDGPTGAGSISGAVTSGAPGIGGPTFTTSAGHANTYVQSTGVATATLRAGIYPNSLATKYWVEYGTSTSYGQQTTVVDVGAGSAPVTVSPALTGLAANTTYHFRVVAQNSVGTMYGYDDSLLTLGAGAPVNVTPPTVSGAARSGQVLSAGPGSWNPGGASYSYQWQRSTDHGATWTSIGGAAATTYTLTHADVSALIRVAVSTANASGAVTAWSVPYGPVAADPPGNTLAPALTGTPQRTHALSSRPGTWTGTGLTLTYQWQRSSDRGSNWQNITGATGVSYTLARADEGDLVRTVVTATNADGAVSVPTNSTGAIVSPYPPANTAPPAVSGTAQRTYTLTATRGTWTGPDNTYAFQWQRDAGDGYEDIPGATGSAYTLITADEGATVRVLVTASNPDATIVEASDPTAIVLSALPVNATRPSLVGVAQRDSSLGGDPGAWTGLANTFAYQWQNSADGSTWTDIPNATSLTYGLRTSDEGLRARLKVIVSNPDGTGSAYSDASAVVSAAPPVNLSAPALTGTAARGSTLSASQGTWAGVGNTYAYQWQRDNGLGFVSITGATGAGYPVAVADEGMRLRVLVTATNPDGTVSAVSSPTPAAIATPPAAGGVPTISGTAARASTLTTSLGTWTGSGNQLTAQWQRSADGVTWTAIPGATATAYTVSVADEGARLRVVLTASNPDGSASATSASTTLISAAPPMNTAAPAVSGVTRRTGVLTASSGTWAGIGNTYADQWQRSADGLNWTPVAGATGSSYTLGVADEGARLRVVVSASNADGTASVASAGTAFVVGAPAFNWAAPVITGALARGELLSASTGTWDGIGNSYTYAWQRSGDGTSWTAIPGANSATYEIAVADERNHLRVVVTATNDDGAVSAASPATSSVPANPPINLTAPSVAGTAQRGQTLSATTGAWYGDQNTYLIAWQRSVDGTTWATVAGATATRYTLGVSDEGARLRVLVTASNPDGSASATSAPTSSVPASPPVNTAAPTIAGTPSRGGTLTASTGAWAGVGNAYTYQWQRSADAASWTAIPGASAAAYTVAVADENTRLRVLVSAANDDGVATAPSAATGAAQADPPRNFVAPVLTGNAQRAQTLTAGPGTWSGNANTYSYAWQRSADGVIWTTIAEATGATYTIGVADEHARLRVTVTATNPDATVTAASNSTGVVSGAPPVNLTSPRLAGGPAVRAGILTASPGTWSGIGNAYRYGWQRSADGVTWTAIPGATDTSYVLGVADENTRVRALVTAVNDDATVSAASAASAVIQSAPPGNIGLPTLSGMAQRTQMLTVSTVSGTPGMWSGVGNTYSYQWQRSLGGAGWVPVSGATSASYALGAVDEGARLRVMVTATNPDGTVAVGSPASSPVATAPPLSTTAPAITGTAKLGGVLTATAGQWTPADTTVTYAWQRSAGGSGWATIPGATDASYTLSTADVGDLVRVLATATNIDGSATAPSAPSATVLAPPRVTRAPSAPSGTLMDTYVLSANSGSWDTPGATFAYTWARCPAGATTADSSCVTVGTGSSYTLAAADVGHSIAVSVRATSAGGTSSAVWSVVSAPVLGRPLTNTALPSITGIAQVPNHVNANPGSWSVPTTSVSYTWYRCDLDGVSNCVQAAGDVTQYNLGVADEDHTIVLAADVTSPGRSASARSAPVTVMDMPRPVNTAAPSVTGVAARGNRLTGNVGAWTNSPTYAYQWQRCASDGSGCADIEGATDSTYTAVADDERHALGLTVTATNGGGSTDAAARPTTAVAPVLPSTTAKPQPRGASVQQSVPLTVDLITWNSPDTPALAVSWQRCASDGTGCQRLPGAQSPLYVPTSADVGHTLRAAIAASNVDGTTVVTSDPTSIVLPAPPRWKILPFISAPSAGVGDAVSVTPASWSGPVVTSRVTELMSCTSTCVNVGAPNVSSHAIDTSELGAILRVRETASNSGGATVVWSARYVGPVVSAAVASGVLSSGSVAVRNVSGQALATAALSAVPQVQIAAVRRAAGAARRTVVVRRGRRVTGPLRTWACPVATGAAGAPLPCSRAVTFAGARTTLRLPAGSAGRIRVIVVRRRRG